MNLIPKINNKNILDVPHNIFFYSKYNLLVIKLIDINKELEDEMESHRRDILNPLEVHISFENLFLETKNNVYYFSEVYKKIEELLKLNNEITISLSYKEKVDGSLDLINLGKINNETPKLLNNLKEDNIYIYNYNDEEKELNIFNSIIDINKKNKNNECISKFLNNNYEILFYGSYFPFSPLEDKTQAVFFDYSTSKFIINLDLLATKELNYLFLQILSKVIYEEMK